MAAERMGIDEGDLAALESLLRGASGLSLSAGMRGALPGAVREAAVAAGTDPETLLRRALAGGAEAVAALVEHTVVGETCFWRHPEQLAALQQVVGSGNGPLHLWSAGCASGEEPYSLAMALLEAGRRGRGDRILATDISAGAIARARTARYPAWSLRRLPDDLRRRYLEGEPPAAGVVREVREMVSLSRNNLVSDPLPGSEFDVVVCRNVLIYFDPVLAAEVLYKLFAATRPGGILVLGPVELPLAQEIEAEWLDVAGASLLRRPATR